MIYPDEVSPLPVSVSRNAGVRHNGNATFLILHAAQRPAAAAPQLLAPPRDTATAGGNGGA